MGTAGIWGAFPSMAEAQSQIQLIPRIHFLKLTAQLQFSDIDKERGPLGPQKEEAEAGRKGGLPRTGNGTTSSVLQWGPWARS